MDDWYVLASRPNVYTLIYYCGCNDACCGYAGAVLYTRSPRFEDLSTQAFAGCGVCRVDVCVCVEHLNRCKTSISFRDCRGPRLHSSVRGQRSY